MRLSFKKPAEDPKILIVTDKLLTGYDAPVLYAMYLDKPMRDHVLLQALARVNRPYEDVNGIEKPIGLVVDFVGVLRDIRKALTFDSQDVQGVVEDLDVLMQDFKTKMAQARQDYLESPVQGDTVDRLESLLEQMVDPQARKQFFERYKEIEALWEILSPDPELRDFIAPYKSLTTLYATVRNAFAQHVAPTADLANKTRQLIQEGVQQGEIKLLPTSVTFDVETLKTLQGEDSSETGKVFNLVRGLRQEAEENPAAAPILQTLTERAGRVLDDLESRRTTAAEALKYLAKLAAEKEQAMREAQDSGLSMQAFAVAWALRKNEPLRAAGIDVHAVAREADELLTKFPNAAVNAEEKRLFRLALYKPLLTLSAVERSKVVDQVMKALLGEA